MRSAALVWMLVMTGAVGWLSLDHWRHRNDLTIVAGTPSVNSPQFNVPPITGDFASPSISDSYLRNAIRNGRDNMPSNEPVDP